MPNLNKIKNYAIILVEDIIMEKSKVYFTKEISEEKVVEMFKILNKDLKGKVAVKVHSGEKGNQNYLRPEFLK